MIEGGCFCKRIRYTIDAGEYLTANCHCTMCRRVHAAPYVTWLVVPVDRFRYTREAPTTLASSSGGTRYFCSACGTHLACVNTSHPEVIDVTLGSLDAPEAFEPTLEVFVDTRLRGVAPLEQNGRRHPAGASTAGSESTVRPVVTREADCALEQWDDVTRGTVRWRTLFSGDRTPTRTLTCGIAELPAVRAGEPSGLHSHEPAELYYILEGSGVLTIDGIDHVVSAGSAAFIPGNAIHGLRNVGTTTLRLLYTFAVDSFDQVEYRFPTPAEA